MLEYLLSAHHFRTSEISDNEEDVAVYPSDGIVTYQTRHWRNSRDAKFPKGVKPLAVRYQEYYDDDDYYEIEWYVLGSDGNEYSLGFDRRDYWWGKGERVTDITLYLKDKKAALSLRFLHLPNW